MRNSVLSSSQRPSSSPRCPSLYLRRRQVVRPSSSKTPSAHSTSIQSSGVAGSRPALRKTANFKMTSLFSPKSSNYERLEGGMGPSRLNSVRRFGWKKFAIAAVFVVGLVWVFGPRKEDIIPDKYKPSLDTPLFGGSEEETAQPPSPLPVPTHHTIDPPHEDDDILSPAKPRPTSPESDPDPSKTVYCTSPSKATLPLVQYVLMIDAGSTGSRIHIYKFNNCGSSPEYEYEVFKQVKPGPSSYADSPLEAAESLDELLDEAVKIVPESMQTCTPVAVKATAGLRLLGAEESSAILEAVRHRLHEKYPFSLQGDDSVAIMDGSDEGVYAWITVNYLMNTIRASSPADTLTHAVLDLGGASTQIVFEPAFDSTQPDSTLEEGEHKYELKFGGRTYTLYQHSYLGYGLMRARESVHTLVDFMASFQHRNGPDGRVSNPCLAQDTTRVVKITDADTDTSRNVTMVGADVGSFEGCNRVMELVLAKDAICEMKPCAFNGVYQPSLLDTFPTGKVLLLSYFYDRLRPLIPESPTSPPIKVSTLATLAEQLCPGKSSWKDHWGNDEDLLEELEGRPEWCLDMTFMHALLRLGYELGEDREVEIGKQIDGTELGWALGASITMVGAELKCRV
ncbi:hypothetical protein NM688_g4910 [Phlebia brevispora]|uniref:Uncharacterized protein n=1 Tax=Phlebia brevispora TaxID=194682 RepID=A0ACC1T1S5_9APHY|nr:hypothetical protein NM688_g4910 [Phlebia brevispora]